MKQHYAIQASDFMFILVNQIIVFLVQQQYFGNCDNKQLLNMKNNDMFVCT